MQKILFLMKYPLHRSENLKRKFDGQMQAARELGLDAYCIGWDTKGMYLVNETHQTLLCKNTFTSVRGYDHTKIFIDLMKAAEIAMQRISIDIVYLRYMPTFSSAVKTINRFKKNGGKLIVEYPTYPIAQENERFFIRKQVFRYTDRIMGKIHPLVDLYTLIGDDCGGSLNGRPAMNIVNGVTVESLLLHAPRAGASDIRLLALASMSGWHGYDRIIRSLAEYKGNADVRIEFVGGDGDGSLAKWKTLAEELKITDRITFRGPCYGDELEDLIRRCDIGIGSLGMFRYGLQQGMTLKAREFMARGLPFISAVDDPAMPDDQRFILRVTNDETPIQMETIVSFAQAVQNDIDLPEDMRNYAKQNLSWTSIIQGVLERLSQ